MEWPEMKTICVFCGSSSGRDRIYSKTARELGAMIAKKGFSLVYGGGNIGLMDNVASACMENGGRVTGVIPEFFEKKELAHTNITELKIVKSMHERKAVMENLSDAFIALPGGLGTLEEFAEMITWAQLGFHKKPCGLLNVNNYYDNLIKFFNTSVEEQFLKTKYRDLILVEDKPKKLLETLSMCYNKYSEKDWID
jgi:hypothetical protein